MAAIVVFRLQFNGFSNRDLRTLLAELLGLPPAQFSAGRMTYDLRRLRLHGLIERIPGTHRYRPTAQGTRIALFFTHAYNRFLRTGLAQIVDPATPSRLSAAFRRLESELDRLAASASLVA